MYKALLKYLFFAFWAVCCYGVSGRSADSVVQDAITLEGQRILVKINPQTCRWSAELKGTDVKISDIYFLEDNNPEPWNVTATVNHDDQNQLGNFETATLHGIKKGEPDFDYHISVSKTGNDIIVSLDRANHTGNPVEIVDMDYMVSNNARLGGTSGQWLTFGCLSLWYPYYKILPVTSPERRKMYEVCYLARNSENGQTVLMGHLTTQKGHSRFEIIANNDPASMSIKAYCNYKITMPEGQAFAGEKLLLHLSDNALRGLEHLGDLIGIASIVHLKEKRPINYSDTTLVSHIHCGWSGWCSGGTPETAGKFIRKYGFDKFYYGASGQDFGKFIKWGLYYCGGRGDYATGTDYPEECYLPVQVPWGNGQVLDFSNPLSVKMEKRRLADALTGNKKKVNLGFLDFAQDWDKWPNQRDPFLSALETWHIGAAPWRDAVDSVAPRMRNMACISRPDFNYGYADLQRMERDADISYTGGGSFLGECVPGITTRFFYNTRVFWNDGDNFHIYRYISPYAPPSAWRRIVPYDEAKVIANFKGFATSSVRPAESFDQAYPEDRLELLRRIAPVTTDAAYPVDLFEREPAAVWNMPVERPFGKWNILAVFNYGPENPELTVTLDAAKDLRLAPDKEYLVYEFWSRKLVGAFKGKFTSRTIDNKDCDIYAIVEKRDHPVLLSTSRHIRQMAFDIKDMGWDEHKAGLHGTSRSVIGDPYQLRVYVPSNWSFDRLGIPATLSAKVTMDGNLLLVDYTNTTDADVTWEISFRKNK